MPRAPSDQVWEASDGERNLVCGSEHLGGGGLGGGGLHAAHNNVSVQRTHQHLLHLQNRITK